MSTHATIVDIRHDANENKKWAGRIIYLQSFATIYAGLILKSQDKK
jgi:hypothetical protein